MGSHRVGQQQHIYIYLFCFIVNNILHFANNLKSTISTIINQEKCSILMESSFKVPLFWLKCPNNS